MLQRLSMLMLSAMLYMGASTASATVTLSVPNYPIIAQLESGWNNAFVAILANIHGSTPTITATTTYQGGGGEVYVVSSFTVGSILGLAFDPTTATSLGSGNYRYTASEGFRCEASSYCSCSAIRVKHTNGDIEERCDCNGGQGGCTYLPIDGLLTGTYDLNPSSYSGLPTMN